MDNVTGMEVMQTLQDLNDITCDEAFVELSKSLEGLTQGPIFGISGMRG